MNSQQHDNNLSAQHETYASDVIETVIKLVVRQFDKQLNEEILDLPFDQLSTEYLDKIEIVMRLEDHYSIQITDIEVDEIILVRDFVRIVQSKKQ